VTSQTQVPAEVLKTDSSYNQHWTVQLDPNGIYGPDGKVIEKSSIVPDNDGRLYGVIDSGFTLPQVPRSVSDSIYGRVRGANYSVEKNLWTFPCEQELNISFAIGGYKYPVHPLDTSSKDLGFDDANGNFVCIGTVRSRVISSSEISLTLCGLIVPADYFCFQSRWSVRSDFRHGFPCKHLMLFHANSYTLTFSLA
jgi:hypothetical protein